MCWIGQDGPTSSTSCKFAPAPATHGLRVGVKLKICLDLGMSPRTVFLLSSAIAFFFGSLNRAVWVDEMLHFVLAGLAWPEIFAIIQETSGSVNHGQTWMAQLVSIASLKILGANEISLRILSIVSTIVFLYTSLRILSIFEVPWQLQLTFVGSTLLINDFAFQMGNARPYMPLLAASSALLYCLLRLWSVHGSKYAAPLFLIFAMIGALVHPYFPAIIGTLVVVVLTLAPQSADLGREGFASKRRFILASTVGSWLLAFAVGSVTWIPKSPDFSYMDPFSTLPLEVGQLEFGIATGAVVAISALFVLYRIFHEDRSRREPRALATGLALAGLLLALIFSWISYVRGYWIIPRQWLPGAHLFFLGITMLLATILKSRLGFRLTKFGRRTHQALAAIPFLLLSTAVSLEGWEIYENSLLRSNTTLAAVWESNDRNEFFVAAANLNIVCDREVWPELGEYYSTASVFEVREQLVKTRSEC